MKLSEAIEIKRRQREGYTTYSCEKIDEAEQLLIEAGKGIQKCRQYPECPFTELLPGETEE